MKNTASLQYSKGRYETSSDVVKVVVLGYGLAGKGFHCYLIRLASSSKYKSKIELYGVMVRSEAKKELIEKEQGNIKIFNNLGQVLQDGNVDLIVIGTPNNTHYTFALQCLKARKHVIVDKPACLSVKEFDELVQVSQQNKVLFTVFHNRRWDGDFLTVKKLMENTETMGEVRWVEMAWQKFGVYSETKQWKNHSIKDGCGKFWDLGPHLIDQALQLFGIEHGVKNVFCCIHFDSKQNPESDSHALVYIEFGNGATAICDVSSSTLIPKPRFYICGEKATFVKCGIDTQEQFMLKEDLDSAKDPESAYGTIKSVSGDEKTIETLQGKWCLFYPNIANVLLKGEEPLVSVESARMVMQVMEAALKSAETRAVVTLNLPGIKKQ